MTGPDARPQGMQHAPSHRGHGWMMIVCCIPMIVIAVALVVAGVVGPTFLLLAVACTAIMALMMRGMDHGGSHQAGHDHATHGAHDQPSDR